MWQRQHPFAPVAIAAPPHLTESDTGMTQGVVELDIFSGRPNPTWHLSAVQGARLAAMLQALPVTSAAAPPDVLGYRGFIVCMADPATTRRTCARVYGGTVYPHEGIGAIWRTDQQQRVERFLLETAQPWIEASLYTFVMQALPSHGQ